MCNCEDKGFKCPDCKCNLKIVKDDTQEETNNKCNCTMNLNDSSTPKLNMNLNE